MAIINAPYREGKGRLSEQILHRKHSPSQLRLSLFKVKPERQLHWNEPGVFVHSCAQLILDKCAQLILDKCAQLILDKLFAHSSISVKEENTQLKSFALLWTSSASPKLANRIV